MNNYEIKEFTITTLQNPNYIKPVRINYKQDNISKTWEAVKSHESVAVLLYHKDKDAFVLVKQFRPPVYMNNKNHTCTYELCAGLIDKEKPIKEIVKEEILEECGYLVQIEQIEKITSFFTNVGISGATQYLYYATISEDLKINEGGGINDEQIEVIYLPKNKAKEFIFDETKAKTPGLMFAFYWFFEKYK
jgi:UDP-sugar diphosphatase